jgi:hypothetical protein
MLMLIGATPEGRKELLGFPVGMRESAQSWRELLVDLKVRGLLIAPELAARDGAPGFYCMAATFRASGRSGFFLLGRQSAKSGDEVLETNTIRGKALLRDIRHI